MASIDIKMERRRAEVTLNEFWKKSLGLRNDVHFCHVLGIFQYTDEISSTPVFVCELYDGNVVMVDVANVKFLDTIGGDLL